MATKKKAPARKPAKGRGTTARKSTAKRAVSKKVVPRVGKPSKKAASAAATDERRVRRAIFIDVENTSSEEALTEVLESLKIDRATQPVELTAVGNWRVAGQRLGRHLAGLGAQLVHSAPAPGVKDWSDLWIAVAAGCWLGRAEPGDVLDIVSNDRAFDAVNDAAAARGVIFHRLQHRRGGATAAHAAARADDEERPARRSRRGGRRRGGRRRSEHAIAAAGGATAATAPAAPPRVATHEHAGHARPHVEVEPHAASRDQILLVIDRLTGGDSSRWVNLDILEKALKAEGFARPPGSPRLVTRLRSLKDFELDSHGRVRIVPGVSVPTPIPVSLEEAPAPAAETAGAKRAAPKRRRSRRKSSAGSGDGPAEPPPLEARAAIVEPPQE